MIPDPVAGQSLLENWLFQLIRLHIMKCILLSLKLIPVIDLWGLDEGVIGEDSL